jgi:Fe-S-cluster containining protein
MSEGCRGCTGRCCYDIVVHVTPFDVWRIASEQALSPLQIVEPREVQPREGPSAAVFGARLDATERRFRCVLRKSLHEPLACQFLLHLGGGQKRCGIYPHRPRVCAVYPFAIHRGSVDLRDDARCGAGDWNLALVDYAAMRRELAVYDAEWHAAAGIATVWNDAVKAGAVTPSFPTFVAYAHAAAGTILETSAADAPPLERWAEAMLPEDVTVPLQRWLDGVRLASEGALVTASAAPT